MKFILIITLFTFSCGPNDTVTNKKINKPAQQIEVKFDTPLVVTVFK